jgi:hypothetical protein
LLDPTPTVVIAGKEHRLRYTLSARSDIERVTEKNPWDAMKSGLLSDQVAILWAGLKHADRKLTTGGVLDMLERHVEGGDDYDPIMRKAYGALVASRALGKVNLEEFERIWKDSEEGEGKAPAGPAV